MQVARHWRNKKLRYRLIRTMARRRKEQAVSAVERREEAAHDLATDKKRIGALT